MGIFFLRLKLRLVVYGILDNVRKYRTTKVRWFKKDKIIKAILAKNQKRPQAPDTRGLTIFLSSE